jgi:hypothetical protein
VCITVSCHVILVTGKLFTYIPKTIRNLSLIFLVTGKDLCRLSHVVGGGGGGGGAGLGLELNELVSSMQLLFSFGVG